MPLMYNAMALTRIVKRSIVSTLILAFLSVPAFSFSWWRHHTPQPQIIVAGHALLFTVLPTLDKDKVLHAPVDFVRTMGADFTVNPGNTTLTVKTADGRSVVVPYQAMDDRCIVDVKQLADSMGADTSWDSKRATLTLRAKILVMREDGGNLKVVTSYPVDYSTGALSDPSRIYVDLAGAVLPDSPTTVPVMADGVQQIRSKQIDFNTVRVALDLNHVARVAPASTEKLSNIVVALGTLGPTDTAPPLPVTPSPTNVAALPAAPNEPTIKPASSAPAIAGGNGAKITGITTLTDSNGKLDVVITTSGALTAPFATYSFDNPSRFALDLPSAVLALPATLAAGPMSVKDSIIKAVRWGNVDMNGATYARIVLDLTSAETFVVTPAPLADGSGMSYTIEPGTPGIQPIPGGVPGDVGNTEIKPYNPNLAGKHLSDLTIVVDPGHGGKDGGAPGSAGLWEKDLTLAIGKDLRDLLVADKAKVIMTREDDTFIPLPVRSQDGIDGNADLFVSIHCDSGNYRNAQEGSTVYYHSNDKVCRELALHIAAKLNEANLGIKSDGVRTDYVRFPGVGFSVLRRSPEPAVLVECGYVNNDDDAKALSDSDTQKQIAEGIVAGIQDYIANQVASR